VGKLGMSSQQFRMQEYSKNDKIKNICTYRYIV
jgi:glutathione peroxidase-family protein